jgi:broad specificity phosphatase PhoE
VRKSASELARSLDNSIVVTIFSSPVGRTLHTAKIIIEVLVEAGFSVNAIQPDKTLVEVANFSWALFEPLMNGGVVTYGNEGQQFEVKKSDTNPCNLGYPDYFINDSVHLIPKQVKETWPEAYTATVDRFERFVNVTNRFLSRIEEVAKADEGHFILVTHDCASMYLADQYTNGRQKGLIPGTFLSIERRDDDRLVVTRVGDITDGNSETNFFGHWI